ADSELLVVGGGEAAHTLDELIGRARRRQVANQRGGEESLLLGTRPDEVALVEREVAGVGRLESLVETAVLGHSWCKCIGHARLEGSVHDAVEEGEGEGTGLGPGARTVGGLAVIEDRAHRERGLVERRRGTPDPPTAVLHLPDITHGARGPPDEGKPAVGDLRGERASPRSERRDVERDAPAHAEETTVRIEKAHRPRGPFGVPLYGLAREQPANDADVLAKVDE